MRKFKVSDSENGMLLMKAILKISSAIRPRKYIPN